MHEKTPITKNGVNFISMSNSKEKHPEIAMHIHIYSFYSFGDVVWNPNSNELCALADSIFRESLPWNCIALDLFKENAGLCKTEPVYCQRVQGTWTIGGNVYILKGDVFFSTSISVGTQHQFDSKRRCSIC